MTLTEISPGEQAHIDGFSDELPFPQQEHLRAYGLEAGRSIRVLQHSPVTVIQIEHLELALERELARAVQVSLKPRH